MDDQEAIKAVFAELTADASLHDLISMLTELRAFQRLLIALIQKEIADAH